MRARAADSGRRLPGAAWLILTVATLALAAAAALFLRPFAKPQRPAVEPAIASPQEPPAPQPPAVAPSEPIPADPTPTAAVVPADGVPAAAAAEAAAAEPEANAEGRAHGASASATESPAAAPGSPRSKAREREPKPLPKVPLAASAEVPAAAAAPAPATAPSETEASEHLQHALQCLSHGDNDCVIHALEGNAKSAYEIALLIATYNSVGELAKAKREMSRYLAKFPSGPRAGEYQRALKDRGAAASNEQAPSDPSAAPTTADREITTP
jgi:hypothetical protein